MAIHMFRLAVGLLVLAAAVGGCAHRVGEQYFRAEGFAPADIRNKRMALVVLDERDALPDPGWCFFRATRPGCLDRTFEATGGFFGNLVEQLTQEFAEHGVEIVHVPPGEFRLDRTSQHPLRYAAESAYELSPEVRSDLASMTARHDAEVLLVLREWGLEVSHGSPPRVVPNPGASPSIPGSSNPGAGGTAGGVSYRLSLEGAIFDARGSLLYHGRTSGGAPQFLFFLETAIRSAVSDAIENFVKLTTGEWPDENVRVAD